MLTAFDRHRASQSCAWATVTEHRGAVRACEAGAKQTLSQIDIASTPLRVTGSKVGEYVTEKKESWPWSPLVPACCSFHKRQSRASVGHVVTVPRGSVCGGQEGHGIWH